jgi:hypothetical protein
MGQIKNQNSTIIKELFRCVNIAKKTDLYLVCWCVPKRCHAEIIKRILEQNY